MRKTASIPVRLDPDIERRLDVLGQHLRLSKSAIIRMLLEEFVVHCERHGNRIVMPPEFTEYEIVERSSRTHAKAAEQRERYGKA